MSENKFEQWAQARFQGLTREELREAGKMFNCTFGPNTSEQMMRIKLCERIGEAPMKEPEAPPPVAARRGAKPNLTSKGVWEGRRQRVILSRQPHEMQNKCKALIWEADTRFFPYDEIVDMPEPWFNVMKDAMSAHVYQKPIKDEEGNLTGYQRIETPFPVHAFRYIGVTPGTEDLPTDLCDYWKREAKRSNFFAGLSRAALIKINADFVGSIGAAYYKDMTLEEIRYEVLRRCNLEDAALELERGTAEQAA